MFLLEYYFSKNKISSKEITPEHTIVMLGSGDCAYSFNYDSNLAANHLMICVQNNKIQICPLSYVKYGETVLDLNQWFFVDTNVELILTNDSVVIFREKTIPKTTSSFGTMARTKESLSNRTQSMPIMKSENNLQIDGKRIGSRYEIHKKIGEGAMGAIYEAFDQELLRTVALKILVHQNINSTEGKRFLREAQTIVKLQHPNIIHVYDIREFQGHPFFTMDLIEGQTLEEVIKNNEYSLRDAMQWIRDIAYALDCAHQAGIIHRDVKPSNIMLDHGTPILMDFGIARDLDSNVTRLTTTGETLGTPTYMSPEQAQSDNNNIGPWTDVYGLGTVLYELLAKHPPFVGTPIDILQKVCTVDPVSVRKYNPDIPYDALVIVKKAMVKERQYRYQSIKEMGDDIQQFLDEKPLTTKMPSSFLYLKRIIKNNKVLFIIAASILSIIIAIVGFKIFQDYTEEQKKYIEIKNEINSIINQHERAKKEYSQYPFPTQLAVSLSEKYTNLLTKGAPNYIIFPYKVDTSMLLIHALIETNQFELAEAYLGLLEEDSKNIPSTKNNKGLWYSQKDIENYITKSREDIDEKRLIEEEIQVKNAFQILRIIPEKCDQELINDFAFSLLVYQDSRKALQSFLNQQDESDPNSLKITDSIVEVLDRLDEFILKRQGIKQTIQGLTPQEEYVFQLLSYTSDYLNQQLLKNIKDKNKNKSDIDSESDTESDTEDNDDDNENNQFENNNSNIRIFCTHVLGLSHFSSSQDTERAINTLITALKNSQEQKFIDVAIKALISLDKKPIKQTRLFQEVNAHEKLLDKLSSHWAINILLTLLETKPSIENFIIQHHLDSIEQIIAQYENVMKKENEKNYTDEYRHSLCRIIARNKNSHSISVLLNTFKNINSKINENEKIFMLKLFLDYNVEDEKITKVLLKELEDKNTTPAIQKYIIQLVGKMPNIDIIRTLLEFLNNENQSIQNTTLEVLMKIPSNLRFVINQYLTEHQLLSSETKLLFYILLTSLKDPNYCETLIDSVNSVRPDKVELILKALANLEEYAIREFNKIYKKKNSIQKLYILRSVSYMKSNAAFEFITKQYQQTKEFTIKEFILESLVAWPQQAEPFLISVLKTNGNRLGTKAGITLSQIGSTTIPAICAILQDIINSSSNNNEAKTTEQINFEENQDINLTNTLSAFGDEIRSYIIPYLNPTCSRVMIIIINTLKNIKNEKDISLLLDIFNVIDKVTTSEQSKIIKATKNALVELGMQEKDANVEKIATPMIIAALYQTENKRLQSIYLEILGRMKNDEILPKLYDFLKDPDLYKNIALALAAYHLQILPDMLKLLEDDKNNEGVWEYLRHLTRETVYLELQKMIDHKKYSNLIQYIPIALYAYKSDPKTINDLINIIQNQKLGNSHIGNDKNLINNAWKSLEFYPPDKIIEKLMPFLKEHGGDKENFCAYCAKNFAKSIQYLLKEIKKAPKDQEIVSSIKRIIDKIDDKQKDKLKIVWKNSVVSALSSASPEATETLLRILQNDIGLRQVGVPSTKEKKNPNYDARIAGILRATAKRYKTNKKVVASGIQKNIESLVNTMLR